MINFQIRLREKNLHEGVTVLVPTYEHDNYLEQCLKSILYQKTNFPVYIVIYVDFSRNKRTLEIAKNFKLKNPSNIIVFENKKRLYGGLASILTHQFSVKTKFWCILEGDDYFSSEYKLNEQVKILKNNPRAVGTCCKFQILDSEGLSIPHGPDYKCFNTFGKRKNRKKFSGYAHTSSILWRNIVEYKKTPFPKSFFKLKGDPGLEIAMLGAFGIMVCTNESMSVYRITGRGMWSSLSSFEREKLNNEAEIRWQKWMDLRIKVSLYLSSNESTLSIYNILSTLRLIPKEIAYR